MPYIESHVNVTSYFAEITDRVNAIARNGVQAAAEEGARVAGELASQREKTGRMAAMRVLPARGALDGWEASFESPVFYAWFQNDGTLGNRDRALKQPPRTNRDREPGTGVKPLHFLDAGRRAGRKALIAVLEGSLGD